MAVNSNYVRPTLGLTIATVAVIILTCAATFYIAFTLGGELGVAHAQQLHKLHHQESQQ